MLRMRQLNLFILGNMRLSKKGLLVLTLFACRDSGRDVRDTTGGTLPPVFSAGPANTTNWDLNAGPVMLVSGTSADSAAVVLPLISDSTIASIQETSAPLSGLTFDLFGRAGKVESARTATAIRPDSTRDCYGWPAAAIRSGNSAWRVGFAAGHAHAIMLDSIEAMPSTDSAALAASLAQTAATLPIASDPTFRGLPFRVRSAYTFRLDSVEVVIADVVRSVNEEANPRLEHLLIIGERSAETGSKYAAGYYSRTAGPEETTQATEVLAVVRIGSSRKPAVIVNIEYEDGRKLGLIERIARGEWHSIWRSAYTDC